MEKEEIKTGRNRENTEQLLLKAIGELIDKQGFEQLGINAVAARAGVSKMLIYRYFESLEGLIAAYISHYDFWINYHPQEPDVAHLGDFIKQLFKEQITIIRGNYTLRRLYRWELSTDNAFVKALRQKREERGLQLVETVSRISGRPQEEVAVVATLISSSISYLTLLEENCSVYNNIPIQSDSGWNQIEEGIYQLIDNWINNK